MVKKLPLAFLFCALHLFCTKAVANGDPSNTSTPELVACTAPPPDSFRVISIGYDFITVAWHPSALGDNHLLTVFEEQASNTWDSLYSVSLFNVTSHTINNLNSKKKYKLKLRTVCGNGDPSTSFTVVIPPYGLILELSTEGRTPIDPKPISCLGISFLDPANKWVGFRLSKVVEGVTVKSSLFEFVKEPESRLPIVATIKRLVVKNDLVAANSSFEWPGPIRQADFKFRVGEVEGGIVHGFGKLILKFYPDLLHPSIDLCPDPDFPINPPYLFEPLVAQSVYCPNCPPPGGSGRINKDSIIGSIKVQSPFARYLNLFFPESSFERAVYNITLMDLYGKVVFKEQIEVQEPQIYIPIGGFPSGAYILRIESRGDIQNLKVIKSE